MSDRIGLRREQIIIRQGTEAADAEGQPIVTWATLVTTGNGAVWGRGEFLSGRELEAMQKINTEISVKIVMALRNDVTTKMQVQWKSPVASIAENYNINAIMPAEDRFDMDLMCALVK